MALLLLQVVPSQETDLKTRCRETEPCDMLPSGWNSMNRGNSGSYTCINIIHVDCSSSGALHPTAGRQFRKLLADPCCIVAKLWRTVGSLQIVCPGGCCGEEISIRHDQIVEYG